MKYTSWFVAVVAASFCSSALAENISPSQVEYSFSSDEKDSSKSCYLFNKISNPPDEETIVFRLSTFIDKTDEFKQVNASYKISVSKTGDVIIPLSYAGVTSNTLPNSDGIIGIPNKNGMYSILASGDAARDSFIKNVLAGNYNIQYTNEQKQQVRVYTIVPPPSDDVAHAMEACTKNLM